ncbi:MAG: aryl-sulfate sulfotransferase, partial [Myxococcales bacterium]|nr:aryl-sulfate sulfotransferase [Myxococcales bacterium]
MDQACQPRGSLRARLGAAAVLLALGCGDDTAPPSMDGSSDGSSGESLEDSTTTPDPSSSTSGAVDSSSSDGGLPPLEVEVGIYTYPNQPMVVDLSFSAPDLTVTVEHETDTGMRSGPIPGAPDQTWVRLRGLAPEAGHIVHWSVVDDEGRTDEGDLLITTEAALPGFLPSFTIEGSGAGYGGYVMFDLLGLTARAPASLFVVDTQGITRWHLGRTDQVIGPPAVFAGAKRRDDGTLLYLRDYSIYVIDEMGTELVALTSQDLGLAGLHHDVIELPSGNFLSLSFTFRDIDYPDLGLTHVAGDLLVEITPEGDIVWEWDSFDHLDPLRRRDGFGDPILDPDTLTVANDWTHGNGLVHDPAADTLLYSMRHQDWVILIDRATGDVLWRLGEEGDFTLDAGTWQYHQHSPQWQDDGTLLLYDNGLGNPGLPDRMETSRAVRYAIDPGTMTATQVWEDAAEDFVSPIAGDADRLPDGSILVTDSAIGLDLGLDTAYARVREIDERTS